MDLGTKNGALARAVRYMVRNHPRYDTFPIAYQEVPPRHAQYTFGINPRQKIVHVDTIDNMVHEGPAPVSKAVNQPGAKSGGLAKRMHHANIGRRPRR
jgi:hypothetical protein